MPKQEIFFEQQSGERRIEVLKSYDQGYAREAFNSMSDAALRHLWDTLKPEETYEPAELPSLGDPNGDAEAFLWDELLDQALDDVRLNSSLRSFFIVNETTGSRSESLYVSPDWPSAEAYAKQRLSAAPLPQ